MKPKVGRNFTSERGGGEGVKGEVKNISLHWLQGIFETVPKWLTISGAATAPWICYSGSRNIAIINRLSLLLEQKTEAESYVVGTSSFSLVILSCRDLTSVCLNVTSRCQNMANICQNMTSI